MVCLSRTKNYTMYRKSFSFYKPQMLKALIREKEDEAFSFNSRNYSPAHRYLHPLLNSEIFEQSAQAKLPGKSYPQGPRLCSIELTHQCPYSCQHCYGNFGPQNNQGLLKEKISSFFPILKDMGISEVELTGGEPMQNPQFYSILKESLRYFHRVKINTTGFHIKPEDLAPLENDKRRLSFKIDLPGSDPKYVDRFCSWQGAFIRTKKAIKILAEKGFTVEIFMPVTPQNLDQIQKTAEYAVKWKAASFTPSPVIPAGKGASAEFCFSAEEEKIFSEQLNQTLHKNEELFKPQIRKNSLNCGAGTECLVITPKGDLKICPLAQKRELFLGNVLQDDPRHIVQENIFRILPEIPSPGKDNCGDCKQLSYCDGCLIRGLRSFRNLGEGICSWGTFYGKWLLAAENRQSSLNFI